MIYTGILFNICRSSFRSEQQNKSLFHLNKALKEVFRAEMNK